jgi:hypothetical protein
VSKGKDLPAWRWFDRKGQKGRGLERFVAAIHKQEETGAEVRWGEKIQGREFDVTIRHMHRDQTVLTVIECKDLSKRVSINAVEAFVTKAADINASRAIIVSAKGFQRGAIASAKKHRVELWTLSEFIEDWPARLTREPIEALNIRNVQFVGSGEVRYMLPGDEKEALHHVSLILGPAAQIVSFDDMMKRVQPNVLAQLRETSGAKTLRLPFDPGSQVLFPHERLLPLKEIVFEAEIIPAVRLRREIMPPEVKIRRYEYGARNATKTLSDHNLRLGFDTVLKSGVFYRNEWGFTYKCIAVEGDVATMMLLASRQHGRTLDVLFRMSSEHADGYVAIDDPKECRRLEQRFRLLHDKK